MCMPGKKIKVIPPLLCVIKIVEQILNDHNQALIGYLNSIIIYNNNNNNKKKLTLPLKMLMQTQGRTLLNNHDLGAELMSLKPNLKSQQRDWVIT